MLAWLTLVWLVGATNAAFGQGADEPGPMVPTPGPSQSSTETPSSNPNIGPAPTPAADPAPSAGPSTSPAGTPTETSGTRRPSELPGPQAEPEPTWNEGGHSYDLDVLNPLHYLDLGLEFFAAESNRALNSLITQLDQPESNHLKLFGRFRWRWQDANNPTLRPNVRDHDMRIYEGWRLGAVLTMDVLEFNVSVQHVVGTHTDIGEDLWDIHTLNVTVTGFEGEAIRFPLEILNTWIRFVGYIGRGPLTFGRGRLIGSDDWDMQGNNFDGFAAALVDSSTGGGLTVFGMQPVRYSRHAFNAADYGHYLAGVALVGLDPFGQGPSVEDQIARVLLRRNEFDTAWFPVINPRERRLLAGFDIYGILHYTNEIDFVGEYSKVIDGLPHGRKNFWSIGTRIGVLFENIITLEGEAVVQLGQKAGNPILAYLAHGEFTLGVDWVLPFSLSATLDLGSGDDDPLDGLQQGFDPLLPLRHNRFGLLDFFGPRNLLHVGATFRAQIGTTVCVFVSGDYFRSLTNNDGVYDQDNAVRLAPTGSSEPRDLGVMLGGGVEVHYSPRVHLYFGVAQLLLGARFSRRGLNADPTTVYFAAELRF